jgi:tetratricopeptide (TPR) repeat protein
MSISLRPQPIGIFPHPANYLLLPETVKDTPEYADLMKGVYSTAKDSEDLKFYVAAIEEDTETALKNLPDDDSAQTKFNRFVLEPNSNVYKELKEEFTGELAVLLDVVAFTLNLLSEPPGEEKCTEEIAATVLLTQATYQMETGQPQKAVETMQKAADASKNASPVLAAQINMNLGETLHQYQGASANALMYYKRAIDSLKDSELEFEKASTNLNLGICFQELSNGQRGAILEAVKCYQEALNYFKADHFPDQFALAQNNLALGYLSMPMTEASDQLRVGIAVQSLREVLKIWTRDANPEGWQSAQLNLANALQYLPSKHIEENLTEAVKLYEEILEVRKRSENPIGYARLLSNQGNALAHLGIFEHALPKLNEARDLFKKNGEMESAQSIEDVLNEIETTREANSQQSAVNSHQ